jgi:hypothetical protein
MAYGFEVPPSVQPSDATSSLEPRFADVMGQGLAPANAQGLDATVSESVRPEAPAPTFGDVFGEGRQNALPNLNLSPRRQIAKVGEGETDAELVQHLSEFENDSTPDEKKARDLANENDETQALFDEIASNLGQNPSLQRDLDPNAPSPLEGGDTILGGLKHVFTRIRAGLASNDEGVLAAVKSAYENNGQGGKVEVRDGKIWFKRTAKQKMTRFDPDAFEPLLDVIADNAGALLELGGALGSEGALRPLVQGMKGIAGAAAKGAATVASGVAGTAVKQGVQAGVDAASAQAQTNWQEAKKDLAWSFGLNLAGLGLGTAVKAVGGRLAETVKGLASSGSAETRIKQLADVRVGFDKLVESYGGTRTQSQYDVGKRIYGTVDDIGNKLEDTVAMVDSSIKSLAHEKGITAVGVDNLKAKMKDVLRRNGVLFDKEGKAYLASESDDAVSAVAAGLEENGANLVKTAPSGKAKSKAAGALRAREAKAFNSSEGRAARQRLISDYNDMIDASNVAGGIPVETLLSNIRTFQENAKFGMKVGAPDAEVAAYRELQAAAAQDRHDAFTQILDYTKNPFTGQVEAHAMPEAEIYFRAYNQYAEKMDDVMEFRTLFTQRKSAEAFAQALAEPGNAERIIKLKNVLGEHSKEFEVFKGEYLNQAVKKAVNAETGIFVPQVFARQFKNVGQDAVNAMFPVAEQKVIMSAAQAAEKIKTSDLVTPKEADAIKQMIMLAVGDTFKSTKVNYLYQMFGRTSKKAADYLRDEAYLEAAKAAPTDEGRKAILASLAYFEDFLKKATVVKIGGKERYVPTFRRAGVQAVKSVGQAAGGGIAESDPRDPLTSVTEIPDYAKESNLMLQSGM